DKPHCPSDKPHCPPDKPHCPPDKPHCPPDKPHYKPHCHPDKPHCHPDKPHCPPDKPHCHPDKPHCPPRNIILPRCSSRELHCHELDNSSLEKAKRQKPESESENRLTLQPFPNREDLGSQKPAVWKIHNKEFHVMEMPPVIQSLLTAGHITSLPLLDHIMSLCFPVSLFLIQHCQQVQNNMRKKERTRDRAKNILK
uniref:Uncharacterized protein n=1 Tax=Oncorhynchus tshawytscha TaxID=74940 RepID=A0AAZ3QXH7_ONCTS